MVKTTVFAVIAAIALSNSALPAVANVDGVKAQEFNEKISSTGFVKKQCDAQTVRFVTSAAQTVVPELVAECNSVATCEAEEIHIDFVEYTAPVYIIEEEKYGVYLDFNGSNGYVVVTDDKTLYALNNSDDLEYLREAEELYFSVFDGFMYLGDGGMPVSYGDEDADGSSLMYELASSSVTANSSRRDGEIAPKDLEKHIKDYYPEYTLYNKVTRLSSLGYEHETQWQTSYYAICDEYGNYRFSEGNCALHSTYSLLNSWHKNGFINISDYGKKQDIRESIERDSLYSQYGTMVTSASNAGHPEYVWGCNREWYLSQMPTIYTKVRDHAKEKGYNVYGYTAVNTKSTVEYVANTVYKNNITVKLTSDYVPARVNLVDGKASQMFIVGSYTYSNHAVVLIGVYEYVKESEIGSFGVNHFLRFYELSDGYNKESMIFDPNTDANPKLEFLYLAPEPTISRC